MNDIKKRIKELEAEINIDEANIAQMQRQTDALQKQANQIVREILSKRGGIVELQRLIDKEKKDKK